MKPDRARTSSTMPMRKIHRSLQRLCLENIAGNMQCLWAKDYTDNYLNEYQFRYIQGPFSELGERHAATGRGGEAGREVCWGVCCLRAPGTQSTKVHLGKGQSKQRW
ncbi:hypothetical protein JD844_025974 [Phrynosoma platyrhinos]|uniref:Uncharacterized protein n=1 Tax=Phrynosoma platyrhinos TaxID=52577 RepID=A0ABQ7SEB3_PHRPL|nr:hypothetical protein JD844_025974 [Phrynosoma platyrhinos]